LCGNPQHHHFVIGGNQRLDVFLLQVINLTKNLVRKGFSGQTHFQPPRGTNEPIDLFSHHCR
jgi:hypothetical protein